MYARVPAVTTHVPPPLRVGFVSKARGLLSAFHRALGARVAAHAWKVLLASLCVGFVFVYGYSTATHKTSQSLWMDPNNEIVKQQAEFEKFFGESSEFVLLLQPGHRAPSRNMLDRDMLLSSYALQAAIANISVTLDEGTASPDVNTVTLRDVCAPYDLTRPSAPRVCNVRSVFEAWIRDGEDVFALPAERIAEDADIGGTLRDFARLGAVLESMLGGRVYSGVDNRTVVAAEALRFVFHIDSSPAKLRLVKQWQTEVMTFLKHNASEAYPFDILFRDQHAVDTQQLSIFVSDFRFLSGAALCTMTLLCLSLASFGQWVQSRVLLGVCGSAVMALAYFGGTGLCAFAGIADTPTRDTVPFFLLAIGCSHVILLTHSMERTSTEAEQDDRLSLDDIGDLLHIQESRARPPLIVARVMEAVAPSITISTLTIALGFLAVSGSPIAGIRGFAIPAGVCVLFQYVLLLTTFTACMSLDFARSQANRADVFPFFLCPETPMYRRLHPDPASVLVGLFYSRFLKNRICVAVTLVTALVCGAACCYGLASTTVGYVTSIHMGDKQTDFERFFTSEFSYFGDYMFPVSIVLPGQRVIAYDDRSSVGVSMMAVLFEHLLRSPDLLEATLSANNWYLQYLQLLQEGQDFYTNLPLLLPSRFRNCVVCDSNGTVVATRFIAFQTGIESQDRHLHITGTSNLRRLVREAMPSAYAFQPVYAQLAPLMETQVALNMQFAIASAVGFTIAIIFFGRLMPAYFLSVSFSALYVVALYLLVCGVPINSVTIAEFMMVSGVAVEYSTHIIYRYSEVAERGVAGVTDTLVTMATPLVCAAACSLGGLFPLLWGHSILIRLFASLFSILVAVAALGAAVVMPSLLCVSRSYFRR